MKKKIEEMFLAFSISNHPHILKYPAIAVSQYS